MQLGYPTNSSLTTTGCKASISATIISRTSFHQSTCVGRPITASSTSAPTTSRGQPPTTITAPCLWRLRFWTTIVSSRYPRDRTNGIGGEATIDVNVANIDQTNAAFQSTGLQTFDDAYHLYNVCETTVGTKFVNTYYPGACMLRSIAGDYARASGQVSWQRSYIDTIGELEAVRFRSSRWRIRLNSTKPARLPTQAPSGRARSRTRARRRSSPGAIRARSPAAWRESASNTVIRSP